MKLLTSVIASAALCLASTLPVQADYDQQGSYGGHQIDCFGLLFSDPAAHTAQCGGPFDLPPGGPSLSPLEYSPPGCTYGEATLPVTILRQVYVASSCCDAMIAPLGPVQIADASWLPKAYSRAGAAILVATPCID